MTALWRGDNPADAFIEYFSKSALLIAKARASSLRKSLAAPMN
jgi:hypothetical protein